MLLKNKLGVFLKLPRAGEVKTRLVPPLTPEIAASLYGAFLEDLFTRLAKLKSLEITVFHESGSPADFASIAPARSRFVVQTGDSLGERLDNAFAELLAGGGRAVIIGSDSPDIPIQHIRRAHQKLKHRDVAIGPAADGGYYLIGLRAPAPGLFRDINWSSSTVFAETLRAVETHELTLALLPLWYDVDSADGLAVLRAMTHARRLAGGARLQATTRALQSIPED